MSDIIGGTLIWCIVAVNDGGHDLIMYTRSFC